MYSKLEEATFPLVSKINDNRNQTFLKAGTYNPSNLYRNRYRHSNNNRNSIPVQRRNSFFLWKLSDTILEIHEITSSTQLSNNCFIYDFALNQSNPNDQIQLIPQVEFFEYQR